MITENKHVHIYTCLTSLPVQVSSNGGQCCLLRGTTCSRPATRLILASSSSSFTGGWTRATSVGGRRPPLQSAGVTLAIMVRLEAMFDAEILPTRVACHGNKLHTEGNNTASDAKTTHIYKTLGLLHYYTYYYTQGHYTCPSYFVQDISTSSN